MLLFLQLNREIILVKAYVLSECCNLTNFSKVKKMAKISREFVLVKAHLPSECCNLTNFLKVKRKTLFLLGDSFGLRLLLYIPINSEAEKARPQNRPRHHEGRTPLLCHFGSFLHLSNSSKIHWNFT